MGRKVLFLILALVMLLLSFAAAGCAVRDAEGSGSESVDETKLYPRPERYAALVSKYSAEYGVPEYVIYAVILSESGFDADAVSRAGATGLMQLMPATFDWLMMRTGEDLAPEMISDPDTNVRYGTYLLRYLYLKYENWDTVYAAYNAGFGRVDGWLADSAYSKDGVLTDIPIGETKNYVVKVASAAVKYKELYYGPDDELVPVAVTESADATDTQTGTDTTAAVD